MLSFLTKFASLVRGVLSGFDRLFFCGTLRGLSHTRGLQNYLWTHHIPFKDFAAHSLEVSARLEKASLQAAQELKREIRYLNSAQHRKEDIAREIAARDHIRSGLICVLRSVDPCMSFQINKNYKTHKLEIHYRQRKCLHLYHYQIHPIFGFMHTRIQTWFPFRIYVCINGREWLARQMDQAKLHYVRRDNTFTWVEDVTQAQALFDQQLQANWPTLLGELATAVNPLHTGFYTNNPCHYYWTVSDSEWASDVMFHSRAALQEVYPRLLRYAITTFEAVDVLRFLGQHITPTGRIPRSCRAELSSNLRERSEGVRIKHWLNANSLKMYDKDSVLRTECLIRQPYDFKVYRSSEGNPEGPKQWRPLRKGVADLHRRAQVAQAANGRYLEALTAVQDTTPLRQLVEPWCKPVSDPARRKRASGAQALLPPAALAPVNEPPMNQAPLNEAPVNETPPPSPSAAAPARRVRALNPLALGDAALLEAVSRHEFLINGLRNRDLRQCLYGNKPTSPTEQRKQSAAVTRKLRLLRAHGLIRKVPKTHRYMVTEQARRALTALLAARNANADQLTRCAG